MCRATTPPALATPWACASPPSASCPATKPATDPASPTPPARLLAMTTTLLLQLSDPHIREPGRLAYGRINTAPYLAEAVASVNLLPGNHDSREQMRASFPQHHYLGSEGFIQYSVPVGGMQLIALDTVVPGASEGSLCTERLQWLEEELARHTSRPVVIAMHHPPFRTLIGHMDDIGLREGADAHDATGSLHPQVERVICGHLHRAIQVRFGGTIAAAVPSPAHQVRLDLAPDAASAWMLEPPGFALHALPAGGRLVSHTVASGQYAGPYPFHDGGQLID